MPYLIVFGDGDISHNKWFNTLTEADKYAQECGAKEVLAVDVVREYPRLFTEEQRDKLLNSKVDLRAYASTAISGDGIEVDVAYKDLYAMLDEAFVELGLTRGMGIEFDEITWEDFTRDRVGTLEKLKEQNLEMWEALKEWPDLFEKVVKGMWKNYEAYGDPV